MFKQPKIFLVFLAAAALFLILCDAYAKLDTQSALGVTRFKIGYHFASSKSEWLQTYRAEIWDHGGGYIPPEVQRFLCSRLENSASKGEIQAIAEFYASQARGREYGPLDQISDSARIRLIDALFHRWPSKPDSRLQRLFLIEEVRRGAIVGKGNFGIVNFPRFAHYLQIHPHPRNGRETEAVVQEVLLQWWNQPTTPAEKLRQDPLRSAGIEIQSL